MSPRRLSRSLRGLLQPAPLFGLAILVFLWIGVAFLLFVERTNAIEGAIQRGGSLAQLFEENTIRLLRGVDRSLLALRLGYEENPQHFDLRRWTERTSLLGELTFQVAMIGADGYMFASTA